MSSLPPTSISLFPSVSLPALPGDASWTALLADTTWGIRGMGRRRVRVRRRGAGNEPDGLRLVVQSYRPGDVVEGRPSAYARPLASAQRAVDASQLARGVQLDLVHFDEESDDVAIIAWTEAGEPDLDYDGLEARPPADARMERVEPLRS